MLLSQVPYGDVMGKTLVFAVFDFDRFSKNDEIGEVDKINIFQSLSSTWIKHHVRLHWRRKMCKNSAKNRVKHNWYRHCRFGNSRGNYPFLQHYTKMVRHSRWREALNGSQWLWSETLLQSLKMIMVMIMPIILSLNDRNHHPYNHDCEGALASVQHRPCLHGGDVGGDKGHQGRWTRKENHHHGLPAYSHHNKIPSWSSSSSSSSSPSCNHYRQNHHYHHYHPSSLLLVYVTSGSAHNDQTQPSGVHTYTIWWWWWSSYEEWWW